MNVWVQRARSSLWECIYFNETRENCEAFAAATRRAFARIYTVPPAVVVAERGPSRYGRRQHLRHKSPDRRVRGGGS